MRLSKILSAAILIGAAAFGAPSFAGVVLVSESPWSATSLDQDPLNMNDVFGSGGWTRYNSYAGATPGSIFTPSTSFVFLEGGADSDLPLQSYLSAHGPEILDWVSAGGRILVMSAGWDASITGFGPGNIVFDDYANATDNGTLTAAGIAAFTYIPIDPDQHGTELAHDYISGAGLTTLMTGSSALPIIAGTEYGLGYITYAGLTDSQFHDIGNPLVDDLLGFAANVPGRNPVPEPATFGLFGAGLLGLELARRRRARIS